MLEKFEKLRSKMRNGKWNCIVKFYPLHCKLIGSAQIKSNSKLLLSDICSLSKVFYQGQFQ